MNLAERQNLIEIFAQNAAAKRREIRLVEQAERAFEDLRQKEEREEKERERTEEAIMATAEQIGAFRDRLDGYDTATVHALMDNQRALDEVRQRRESMEASAYRLQDGRRVFKTEDGARVFDQHGAEVPRDVVAAPSIPDALPRWEKFKADKDTEQGLIEERQKLHEFQQRVDDARDTIGKGSVSADALTKMDAELQRDMPEAVKARLPGATVGQDAPKVGIGPKAPNQQNVTPAYSDRAISGP